MLVFQLFVINFCCADNMIMNIKYYYDNMIWRKKTLNKRI